MRLLLVVATALEAARLTHELPEGSRVVVSGVGPVASALATAHALAQAPFDLAVSVGIGGAYPGSNLKSGDLAVSSEMIQADLGARDGSQFLSLGALGLSVLPTASNVGRFPAWEGAQALAQAAQAAYGPMLTLCTVTGSAEEAQAWATRYPGALTEGMEGAGVAHAAYLVGLPALELRGISNMVGPRDRSSWNIAGAMAAAQRGLALLSRV